MDWRGFTFGINRQRSATETKVTVKYPYFCDVWVNIWDQREVLWVLESLLIIYFYFTILSLLRAMQPSSDQRMNACPTSLHKTNTMKDGPSLGKDQWTTGQCSTLLNLCSLKAPVSFIILLIPFGSFVVWLCQLCMQQLFFPHKFFFSQILPP